ncbi:MAG TPA: DUF6364 family protein [Acidimicrobiales bacterium]|nr:DUF6364 family protein [Acidimicrobiales bacterium]
MAKRNVTVQLDETVIHRAKVLAAKRSTSVSGLVTRALVDLVEEDDRYEEARRHALAMMRDAGAHGGGQWTRTGLHER